MYSNKIVYYIYIVIMSDIRFWNGNRVRRYIRNYFSKLETLSSTNWFSYLPLISFSWWFYLLSLKVIIPFRNVWLILNAWIAYRFTDILVSTNSFQSYILTLGLHSSILRLSIIQLSWRFILLSYHYHPQLSTILFSNRSTSNFPFWS